MISSYFGIPDNLLSIPLKKTQEWLSNNVDLSLVSYFGHGIVGPLIDLYIVFFKFHQFQIVKNKNHLNTESTSLMLSELEEVRTQYKQSFASSVEELLVTGNAFRLFEFLDDFTSKFDFSFSYLSPKNLLTWMKEHYTSKSNSDSSSFQTKRKTGSFIPSSSLSRSFTPSQNSNTTSSNTQREQKFQLSSHTLVLFTSTYLFSLIMINIPRHFFSFLSLKGIWRQFIPSNKTVDQILTNLNGFLLHPFQRTFRNEDDSSTLKNNNLNSNPSTNTNIPVDCFYIPLSKLVEKNTGEEEDSILQQNNNQPQNSEPINNVGSSTSSPSSYINEDDVRLIKYFIDLIKKWDSLWIPIVNHLKMLVTHPEVSDLTDDEVAMISGGIIKVLKKTIKNVTKTEGQYCIEMGIWINLVHNFSITYPSLGQKTVAVVTPTPTTNTKNKTLIKETKLALLKKSFQSPLKWIKSEYQIYRFSCIDFLDLSRSYLENLMPYPKLVKEYGHPFYYIPFFDETQTVFVEIYKTFYKDNTLIKIAKAEVDGNNSSTSSSSYLTSIRILESQSSKFNTLSKKAKLVYLWFINKQWLTSQVSGFNDLFLIRDGVCFMDPLPDLEEHLTFWSFFYCLHRLCFTATLIRTDEFANYQDVFVTGGIRKLGIYTWEDQINTTYLKMGDFVIKDDDYLQEQKQEEQVEEEEVYQQGEQKEKPLPSYTFTLESIFDDRLDYNLQRYLTCFLEMADWILEFLRPNKDHTQFTERTNRQELKDYFIPLFMLYPYPERDLVKTSMIDIGNYFQYMRLWHDAPSVHLAIVICFEKAISCRSRKRSIGKKLYDCCQKSLGMTKYIRIIVMTIFMGLVRRKYITSFKRNHYGLPVIFRPNFASLYWTWRLFFDRKFSDTVYRFEYKMCEKLLKQRVPNSGGTVKHSGHLFGNVEPPLIPIPNYSPYTLTPWFSASTTTTNASGQSEATNIASGRRKSRGRGSRGRGSRGNGRGNRVERSRGKTRGSGRGRGHGRGGKNKPQEIKLQDEEINGGSFSNSQAQSTMESIPDTNDSQTQPPVTLLTETDDSLWDDNVCGDPRLYGFYPRPLDFPASFQSRQKIYTAVKDEHYVKILLAEELKFREKVYKNRGDALIPIANDLLLSFLHQESDLADDIIKEYFVQHLTSQPQYWLKTMSDFDLEQTQFVDNLLETRWKNYFTRTTILNNVLRFNLDTCIHSITSHIIKTGFYQTIKPWEMDTLISCSLRTINNQNKITRQFNNFFDNNVYTFRKNSITVELHTQLDFFMESLIKESIQLEQDIYDLNFVAHELIPLLINVYDGINSLPQQHHNNNNNESVLNALIKTREDVSDVIIEILQLNGYVENTSLPLKEILSSKVHIHSLQTIVQKVMEERIKRHKYINQPINEELRLFIWNTVFRHSSPSNPYDPSLLGKSIALSSSSAERSDWSMALQYIFQDILTKSEKTFLFKIMKLEDDQVSPEKIHQLISLLPNPIPSFKKIHFIIETIYTGYNLQITPLDFESVQKIHKTMVTSRFKLIPGMPVNYQNMYRAVITYCCNRITSLGKTNTLYGHLYVSYDPIRKVFICNKKKSKKMSYTTPNNTGSGNSGMVPSSNQNNRAIKITEEEYQLIADSGIDVDQLVSTKTKSSQHHAKREKGGSLEKSSVEDQDEDGLEDEEDGMIIPTPLLNSREQGVFFFKHILENNKMGKILVKIPENLTSASFASLMSKWLESSLMMGVTSNFIDEGEEDTGNKLLDYIESLTRELTEYKARPRFKNLETKDQNKIARRLKKVRHPDCVNNPPVICIDTFGKRIFFGRDEKNKKVYQHCLKCGNFTYYMDENWSHEYACFNCWSKEMYLHCRCTYCHNITHKTFDSNHLNVVSKDYKTNDETIKKENMKRVNDILKSQRRERIIHECMKTPQFPLCLIFISKPYQKRIMKSHLNLSDTVITQMDKKQLDHQTLYNNAENILTPLTLSRRYTEVPIYFSGYFCNNHKPLDPNIIQTGGEKQLNYSKTNFNALSGAGAIRTFVVNASNFNINNQYRISFIPHFFALLQKKKKMT
jgi:hypothetical protein